MKTNSSLVSQLSFALLFSTLVLRASTSSAQGPLNPPAGPPASSMKTLEQIEPRKELNPTNTPGNSGNVFLITAPGSYYLSGNVVALPGMNGLNVQSSDVRIDLNGFTVIGGHNSTGISIEAGSSRVEIHNGGVRSFASGVSGTADSIRVHNLTIGACTTGILLGAGALVEDCTISTCQTGISISSGRVARCTMREARAGIALTGTTETGTVADCVVQSIDPPVSNGVGISADFGAVISGCSVRAFGSIGIAAGKNAVVTHCSADGNGQFFTSAGIHAREGSSVTNCTARGNLGSGIYVFNGSMVENCSARDNGQNGIYLSGTAAARNCHAIGNADSGFFLADGASLMGSAASSNGLYGVQMGSYATVQGCNVISNARDGIHIGGGGGLVKENNVHLNGFSAFGGSGIHVGNAGARIRIEHNQVNYNNQAGILLDTGGNILLANSARANEGAGPAPAPDYVGIGGSNIVGTIVDTSAGLNNAANNANANIR